MKKQLMNETSKISNHLSMKQAKEIFGLKYLRQTFLLKADECRQELSELVKISDRLYKTLCDCKLKKDVGGAMIIEDIGIKALESEMAKTEARRIGWLDKLRQLNGGKKHNKFELNEIKAIEIERVLDMYGRKYKRNVFKLRNERTPSCRFNKEKNLWIDHGTQEGGSVIDLYMKINDCDFRDAIKSLSELL